MQSLLLYKEPGIFSRIQFDRIICRFPHIFGLVLSIFFLSARFFPKTGKIAPDIQKAVAEFSHGFCLHRA